MTKSKCILLNGFAGAGKTTIAKRYINDHPLALVIEGDELIVNMGQWVEHEKEARKQTFELTKSMIATHLAAGYDVILPYLVTDASHVEEFGQIAKIHDAEFYEIVLHNNRSEAISRLLKRGTWGEADLPPVTMKDLPQIEKDVDIMEAQLERRPHAKVIAIKDGAIDDTYRQVLEFIV